MLMTLDLDIHIDRAPLPSELEHVIQFLVSLDISADIEIDRATLPPEVERVSFGES